MIRIIPPNTKGKSKQVKKPKLTQIFFALLLSTLTTTNTRAHNVYFSTNKITVHATMKMIDKSQVEQQVQIAVQTILEYAQIDELNEQILLKGNFKSVSFSSNHHFISKILINT